MNFAIKVENLTKSYGQNAVIFLDEPTAGLDVEGRAALHEQIRKLKRSGKTIILASHDMAEVESLCDKIAILKDSKMAFIGTASELATQIHSKKRLHVKTGEPLGKRDFAHSTLEHL